MGRSTSLISTSLLNLSICSIFSLCSSSWPSSCALIISLWNMLLCISSSIFAFSRFSLSKSYSAFSYSTRSLSSARRPAVSLILPAHSSNSFLSPCNCKRFWVKVSQSEARSSRFFSRKRHFLRRSPSLKEIVSLLSSSLIAAIYRSRSCRSRKSVS